MDRHWLLKFGAGARHRVTRRAFSSGFLSALICGALKADAVKPFALDVRTVRLSPGVPTPFSFVHFSDTHLTETTATELAAAGAEGRALYDVAVRGYAPAAASRRTGVSLARIYELRRAFYERCEL